MAGKPVDGNFPTRIRPIPSDLQHGLRARLLRTYDELLIRSRADAHELDAQEVLGHILYNTDIEVALKTLSKAFLPRVINVTTSPTVLIRPSRYPRGYIILNPATTVLATTSNITPLPLVSRAAGTVQSGNFTVTGFKTAAFFLQITVSPTTLQINALTRDPLSLTFAPSQSDLYAGAVSILTRYASIGELGVDDILAIEAVSTGTGTWSVSGVLKDTLGNIIPGQTVFLGNQDVNTVVGYPLLGSMRETWWLRENTTLFGRVVSGTAEIRVFELQ